MAAIGVFIVTRLVAGSLQERFNNQLLDSARAASNSITDIEREQLATLRLMAYTEGVAEAILDGNTDDLDLWLRPIAANARLDDVIIFDSTGQGILQLERVDNYSLEYHTPTPPDLSDRMGVQGVLVAQADEIGDKYVDLVGEPPDALFYISSPVKDDDNQIVGGITVGMKMQRLAVLVSDQALSSVVLYDRDGKVMGSTFRLIALDVLKLSPDETDALVHQAGDYSPIEEVTFNGTPYHVMYTTFELRSQAVGLLAVGLPTNYIVERIGTGRDQFAILFAALFMLVGGLGLATARTITRPVRRLVDATRAIRAGDLSRRVGLKTPDELGELATSFDHMTTQLIARNEEIETLYLQQLQETAQREAVLAGIGDAVFVQDPGGHVLIQNEAAVDLLTLVRSDPTLRQSFFRLIRQPEDLAHPRTVALSGSYFSVLATPVRLPEGKLLGHVIVLRDVTALLNAERLKDELILQMSHELRTPLTAARGYVDIVKVLHAGQLEPQGQKFVNSALDNLTVLERMINQVIDVSAIISNRFTITIRPFNLAELLHDCVDEWQASARNRQLDVSLVLPSDEMWIEGDQHYLSQVIDHLMRNAYSYTLPGGSIEVYAAFKNGNANIYISDNGVGIPQDEIQRVFERMYRGSSADAGPTDARGLGLGLYFSKHIIEAHRGTITLESKTDFGTIVTIELPVRHHD